MAKIELQLVTAEIIREEHLENFVQEIMLTNRRDEAIVGWYNSPTTQKDFSAVR